MDHTKFHYATGTSFEKRAIPNFLTIVCSCEILLFGVILCARKKGRETKMKLITIVCLTTAVVLVAGQNLDECLQQDSISCVQKSIYRKAKEFFGKDSLEIVPGINLIRNQDNNLDGRNARSSKVLIYDQEIDGANDVAERQNVLESFVGEEASNYFTGRSLRVMFIMSLIKNFVDP